MSHAFIRESDEQWLDEIPPTMTALVNYLTRENNGVRVYEKKNYTHPVRGKQVYEMSNGLSYFVNAESKWETID